MNSIVIPPSPNWYVPDILACAPDGTLAYGSNTSIVIVNPKPEDQPADIKLISLAHHERISSISLNLNWNVGNKFVASSGEDKAVKVWNAESLEFHKSHNSHTTNDSKLIGAAYAGSDKIVSVSEDGLIIVWKVSTNELNSINNLFKEKLQVTSFAICPHAHWLCAFGMKNGLVFIADLRLTGQIKHKLRGHEKNSITDLTWCPVPINVFPKVKTKQITLKDRLQKFTDEGKAQQMDRGDSADIKPTENENKLKNPDSTEEVTQVKPVLGEGDNADIKPVQMNVDLEKESDKMEKEETVTSVDGAKDAIEVLNKNDVGNGETSSNSKTEIIGSDEESRRVLEKNRMNTLKSSAYKFKKNNPWVNLKHADDDEMEAAELEQPAPNPVKPPAGDFLQECLSLRDRISKVNTKEADESEEEEEVVKEAKPRAILKARKPKKDSAAVSDELKRPDLKLMINETTKPENIGPDGINDEKLNASVASLLTETDKIKDDVEKVLRDMKELKVESAKSEDNGAVNNDADVKKEAFVEKPTKEFLLASASNNGLIIIWRAGTDGKIETKLSASSKNRYRGRSSRDKIHMSTFWVSPTVLLTSGSNGELLQWDFKNYETKSTSLKSKMIHNDHQSILFSIAAPVDATMPVEGGNWREQKVNTLAAWTIGKERTLLKTSVDSQRKTLGCYQTLGNSVQCLAVSPIDPNKLAIGTADQFIKIWDLSKPHFQCITMTEHKVKGKVVNMAYHPEEENVLVFGTEDGHIGLINPNCASKPAAQLVHYFKSSIYKLDWGPDKNGHGLYACSEGVVILYDVKNPLGTPTVIQTPDSKFITQFAWKQDYSRLALGTKDGSVFLFSRDLEFLTSLFYQQKSIGALFWHPIATTEDEEASPYEFWLASSASDGSIVIYDMKNITGDAELTTRVVAEQKEHTKFIRGLAWSPHEGGKLLSSSEDGTAHVWDVKNKTILSSYLNSYCQPITACTWSPLDKNYVILSGRQCTLFIINVNDYKPMTKEDVTKEMNRRKKKLGGNPLKEKQPKVEEVVVVKKNVNSRDMMFTSITSLQRDKTTLLKDCKHLLAKNEGTSDVENNAVLQLFGSKDDVHKLIEHQQEIHASKSKHGLNQHLSLWKGVTDESIKKAMAEGQLSPWLISIAPMVSPALWQEACESYANQLMEDPNGDGLQAASYFLACHKVEKAIEVLCLRKLFKEALVLAKCRLSSEKSLIDKIIIDWAKYYIINGSYEVSAQCYIALEKYEEAVKALYKRSDLDILELAVELAQKTGNTEMINAIKYRYESFKTSDETNSSIHEEASAKNEENSVKPNELTENQQEEQISDEAEKSESNITGLVENLSIV